MKFYGSFHPKNKLGWVLPLLRRLLGVMPLLMYTLKTGKGIRTQVRARAFALRWLRGDVKGAASLVQGREDTP